MPYLEELGRDDEADKLEGDVVGVTRAGVDWEPTVPFGVSVPCPGPASVGCRGPVHLWPELFGQGQVRATGETGAMARNEADRLALHVPLTVVCLRRDRRWQPARTALAEHPPLLVEFPQRAPSGLSGGVGPSGTQTIPLPTPAGPTRPPPLPIG